MKYRGLQVPGSTSLFPHDILFEGEDDQEIVSPHKGWEAVPMIPQQHD